MAKKKLMNEGLLSAFLSKDDVKTSKHKSSKTSERSDGSKVKLTIYVTEKCDQDIEKLRLAFRRKEGRRITKSEIVEMAIYCLKEKIKS